MKLKYGTSRTVILTKNYAFKLPYIGRWTNFLWGLIANMNEVKFNTMKDDRLARVVFSLPAGFLVVMKRAEPLKEFNKKFLTEFCCSKQCKIPAEIKKDSFGYINGELKAIDYG
jgi:hypothetical protein